MSKTYTIEISAEQLALLASAVESSAFYASNAQHAQLTEMHDMLTDTLLTTEQGVNNFTA